MVVVELPRSAEHCYRAYCDLSQARLWVPGLKKVRIARTDEQGRALEASFEYGDSLSYALVYAYDDALRRVRWVPSAGVRDGISGMALFEETAVGCKATITIDSLRGRTPAHEGDVAAAFARWIQDAAS